MNLILLLLKGATALHGLVALFIGASIGTKSQLIQLYPPDLESDGYSCIN